MTYLTETRYHYFSLDSDHDLTGSTLELSTDGVNWVVATPSTAPPSAASFPAPAAGMSRFWWQVLIGPGETLSLASTEQTVSGHLTDAPEDLYPLWTVYSEDAADSDLTPLHCWDIDTGCLGAQWNTYTEAVQERATLLAVETLRMLTAYRVGGCPVTVRPCRKDCGTLGTWATFPAPGGSAHVRGWQPALASGQWINSACGCANGSAFCTCQPCEQRLPGWVGAIEEVRVDGAILADDAYRVDNGNLLVRLDGECWPTCQDMSLPLTAPGTFGVTYVNGVLPGPMGALAAGRLAGEYAKACSGESCSLPPNARSIARAGVTIELAGEAGDYWPGGLTGLREVDLFIRRLNPHALKTPTTVWSPDVRHSRQTTIPPGIV